MLFKDFLYFFNEKIKFSLFLLGKVVVDICMQTEG